MYIYINALRTLDHHNDASFDGKDLPHGRNDNREEMMAAEVSREEEDEEEEMVLENGRLKGRFVSGSVVNLSRRELSEEDISLLSKGLKFSPTPTDIDKA